MSDQTENSVANILHSTRLLVAGLVAVVIVMGLALVSMTIGETAAPASGVHEKPAKVNVLANSNDDCVSCHRNTTPGIVEQYGHSTMAAADVKCQDCHEVESGYPGSVEHQGTHVLRIPSTAMCAQCHPGEVAQFNQSRHALPSYVAMVGAEALSEEHLEMYASIPEGSFKPDRARNSLYHLEGPAVTRFACHSCHDVGKPHEDGSVGQCQKCHMRHEFSREQVRKPQTCNNCHIGPDHPQWEIYEESKHGIAYTTMGHEWNWHAESGTLDVSDFPAATCAICHMSGFGGTSTTHDVGDRLTWYLFAPISERRPSWQDNKVRMQSVCQECHNTEFVNDLYDDADKLTERINEWVVESNEIIAPLKEKGLLTDAPFDEPIDFTHFNLWHHWGRTAKFGAWMQGADYVQWHGAYEILHDMAELREMTKEKLEAAEKASSDAGTD